jgi:dipeptidyl aminopeptidase/acylaminoacyl peptidase
MQSKVFGILLCVIGITLAACGQQESASQPVPASEPVQTTAAVVTIPKYSAQAFFETTSYGLVGPAAHAFSPDGKSILTSSDVTGVFNAWSLPVDGGAPQQLTSSEDSAVFAVSWFPADKRILYTYDGGGDELNHLIVREIDGTVLDLTPGDELKAGFLGWSDDGQSFYLTSTERDQKSFDVYRYSVSGYDRELVYENPGFQISDISGDGRWVALDKPRTSADSDIYIVDLGSDGREPILITGHTGNIQHASHEFTPDNKSLVYGTDEHGEFRQAWNYDLSSGEKSVLLEAPWDVSYITYSPGGRYQVSGVNADARTEVTLIDTQSGESVELPSLPPGDLRNVRFSADETHIALIVNADDSPSNIHIIDVGGGHAHQLTQALNPAIDQSHLVKSEVIRYKSFDGLEIPSILYKPHGASAENPVPRWYLCTAARVVRPAPVTGQCCSTW